MNLDGTMPQPHNPDKDIRIAVYLLVLTGFGAGFEGSDGKLLSVSQHEAALGAARLGGLCE